MAVSQSTGNTPTGTTPESADDLSQIKRKLAWRMGIAGLMIVGLLGGLWLFDSMTANRGQPDPVAPQFTEPVPVAKKSVTQPLSPPEPVAPSADAGKPAIPESTASPADRASPAEAPPPPEVAAQPSAARQGRAPVRVPGTGAAAEAPVRSAMPKAEAQAAVVSSAEQLGAGGQAPASRSRPTQALPRLLSGFNLQAGVFADPRRAEELHARLLQEGIPATLETRVVVGPFRNREVADSARAKMLVMGIDSVLLPKAVKK